MTRNALVIGHHPGDHAGNFVAPMQDFGFAVHTWIPSAAETPLVAEADADLLVVLGGIMGANDEAEHDWMIGEIRLVERFVKAGKPVLGVCLGGQILARVLGARVYTAEAVELGYLPITTTDRSAALAPFAGNDWRVMQWHKDAFDLPLGARRLAESAMTPNQAFVYGDHCFGLQFHPEASVETVCEWLDKGRGAAEAAGYDPEAIAAEAMQWGRGMERAGAEMMRLWLGEQFAAPAVSLDMKFQA